MHPAFIYIVHQVLDDESRRMSSHLPDPDPSVDPVQRRIGAARPGRSGRSPKAFIGAVVAASRRRMSRDAGGSAA